MDVADLVVLARVIDRGSFAKAAAEMGVPPSTLSRRVASLEAAVGARVLERTTRTMRPTELGELLAHRGRRIRTELEDAERAAADLARAPRGVLRLSVPTPVTDDWLGMALARYLTQYADMRVEVFAEDRYVNLIAEDFDAALRVGGLTDSSLGAIRLATVTPVLAAASSYLDRAPPLKRPSDLAAHAIVSFGKRRKQRWTFVGRGGATEDVELAARAAANSAPLVARLVAGGAGISLLPPTVVKTHRLVTLEPGGYRPISYSFSLVTPSARLIPPKVRALVDILREFVRANPALFDPA
jgi:DNA-binding transcriptional LysR family regulator